MASKEAGTGASEQAGLVVLLVDDEPDVASVTGVHLERHLDDVAVLTETGGEAAIARFDGTIDCVVSDYEMPDIDGLDLLNRVRERDPDLPFILFTARGSEEIASEAISAGVTDYLQKSVGTDQYAVLANRVENAVERRRSQAVASETRARYRQLVEHSPNAIFVHDGEEVLYANDRTAELVGAGRPEDLDGRSPLSWVAHGDRAFVHQRIDRVVEHRERTSWDTHRILRDDEDVRIVEVSGAPVMYEGTQVSQVVMRDVTERDRHERRLETLHEATRDLLTATGMRAVAEITTATLTDVLDEQLAAVWRYDADEDALASVAATGRSRELAPEHDDPGPLPTLSDAVECTVFEDGEPWVIQDYGERDDAARERFETVLLFPLGDHGLLRVASRDAREFTDSERELVGILARSVVAALDRVTEHADGEARGDNV